MALYGDARVATAEPDGTLQEPAPRAAGCEVLRADKVSATRREGRTAWARRLACLRRGETRVVTRVDRLARRRKDLQDMVSRLKARGVTLRATEQPLKTQRATGKAFVDMVGGCAACATHLRRERHQEGLAAAQARGVERGRQPSIAPIEMHRLPPEERLGASAMARRLGMGRASGSRALARRPREA